MRKIANEQPPLGFDHRLLEWLTRLVININGSIDQMHDHDPQSGYPRVPTNGMVRYFNFTDATITQKGFWGYEEGSWVKL